MKSPFPGMDPYLEAYWGDVHTSLITYARDQLRPQMPGDLRVRVEEHVTVQIDDEDEEGEGRERHGYYPDIRVVERPGGESATSAAEAGTAVLEEPLLVPLPMVAETQRSIRILDTRSGNRVVTAIEVLSLTNKFDPAGRAAYLRKQAELREGGVNLVEIDLLRGGPHILAAPAHLLPLPYLSPYRICVIRGHRPYTAEVYRTSLRQRLPRIRIPLRPTDADALLDLQELIDLSYENGGYDKDADYRVDPQPPLQGDDAAWADGWLRQHNRR